MFHAIAGLFAARYHSRPSSSRGSSWTSLSGVVWDPSAGVGFFFWLDRPSLRPNWACAGDEGGRLSTRRHKLKIRAREKPQTTCEFCPTTDILTSTCNQLFRPRMTLATRFEYVNSRKLTHALAVEFPTHDRRRAFAITRQRPFDHGMRHSNSPWEPSPHSAT